MKSTVPHLRNERRCLRALAAVCIAAALLALPAVLPAASAPASAPKLVTVRLLHRNPASQAVITAGEGGATVRLCPTCTDRPISEPVRLAAKAGRLQVRQTFSRVGFARFRGVFELETGGRKPIPMPGVLDVRVRGNNLLLTLRIPMEEYIAAVLSGESGGFQSDEALKAMAVAARSFAARSIGRHRREGFDFCDSTHCQELRLHSRSARMRAACEATKSEILWHGGRPARTFYHRHSGGVTEAARDIWLQSGAPYLPSQEDEFIPKDGHLDEWRAEATKDELRQAMKAAGIAAAAERDLVEVLGRTTSGRVQRLRLGATTVHTSRLMETFGRLMGRPFLRSTLFDLKDEGDRLIFAGRGWGHGVGLCQYGAEQRGLNGQSYREILAHYFPGTTLAVEPPAAPKPPAAKKAAPKKPAPKPAAAKTGIAQKQ